MDNLVSHCVIFFFIIPNQPIFSEGGATGNGKNTRSADINPKETEGGRNQDAACLRPPPVQ